MRTTILAILIAAVTGVRADEPAKPPAKAAPQRTLDPAKLPPNAVIIVSDNPREAFQNVDAIVLSLDEYRKLLETVELARKSAVPERADVPSVCRISVRVESRGPREVAVVRAQYQFRTNAPKAQVALGLQGAKPFNAMMNAKLAALWPNKDDDGYYVQPESPDEHTLTVELESPVNLRAGKPGERGFELGLPGAAITTLDRIELPASAVRPRIGGKSVPPEQLTPANGPALILGPASRLDVAWDGSSPVESPSPVLFVDSKTDVRIDEKAVTIKSRLTAKVMRGAAGRFEIMAPATAELSVEAAGGASAVVEPPKSGAGPWIVRRDPSAADLVVDAVIRVSAGQDVATPIAPVRISGASQERGNITVGASPSLRLSFSIPAGSELARRDAADDASPDAAFAYSRIAGPGPLLEVTSHRVRGLVESRVVHQLTLRNSTWHWQGRLEIRPIRMEASFVDVEVPAEIPEIRAASPDLVDNIALLRDLGGGRRLMRVSFAESRRKPTTVVLDGAYRMSGPAPASGFPLPRVAGTSERDDQVVVAAGTGRDIQGGVREFDGTSVAATERSLEAGPRGAGTASVATERSAASVRVLVRPATGQGVVAAVVEIHPGEGQATIRCRWQFPTDAAALDSIRIRAPASLTGRLRGLDGAAIVPMGSGNWALKPAPGDSEKPVDPGVTYSVPFPIAPGAPVPIPLPVLDDFGAVETDVSIWCAATQRGSIVPASFEGPWMACPPRASADSLLLPAMTLHASGADCPLTIRFERAGPGPLHAVPIERILQQVVIEDNGRELYRIRCLIRPLSSFFPELLLPESASACQFQATLDGQRLNWIASADRNNVVRLRVEPDGGKDRHLDMTYVLAPESGWKWTVTLRPPQWIGVAGLPMARWQIAFPDSRSALPLSDTAEFFDRWVWSRGLLALQPEWSSAGLARWVQGGMRPSDLETPQDESAHNAWAPADRPQRFLVATRAGFTLICSLLVVGIGFAAIAWPSRGSRALIATVIIALFIVAAVRPSLAASLLIHSQVGWIVLAIAFMARRFLTRPTKQVEAFLPRGVASTADRGARTVREPSTVDAPAAI